MTKIVLKQKFKEKIEFLGVRIIFYHVICTADIFQPTHLVQIGKTVRKNGPPLRQGEPGTSQYIIHGQGSPTNCPCHFIPITTLRLSMI